MLLYFIRWQVQGEQLPQERQALHLEPQDGSDATRAELHIPVSEGGTT